MIKIERTTDLELNEMGCLVTGAGRGAGKGIALELARAGARLALADLDPVTVQATAKQIEEEGGQAFPFTADVSDENQVNTMVKGAEEALGQLDVLVNTVAWIDPPGPIVDLPTERWLKTIATNLNSTFFCSRAALRGMLDRRSGHIITTSSVNGTRGFPDRAAYGATKAAIINFTETMAMECREFGVRANCLVPGGIEGERVKILTELYAQQSAASGRPTDISLPQNDPTRVLLTPEQIGRFVVYLVSDDGKLINGQALTLGEAKMSPRQVWF